MWHKIRLQSYRRFGGKFRYLSCTPCGAARLVATAAGPWETFALQCPYLEKSLGRLPPRQPATLQTLCIEAVADGVGDLRAAWKVAYATNRRVPPDQASGDPAQVAAQIALAHALAVHKAGTPGTSDSAKFFPPHLRAELEIVLQSRWQAAQSDLRPSACSAEPWGGLKAQCSLSACNRCARARVPMNARVNKDHYLYGLELARRASAAAADQEGDINLRQGHGIRLARFLFEVAFFALNNPIRSAGRGGGGRAASAHGDADDDTPGGNGGAGEIGFTLGEGLAHFSMEWTRPLELNRPRRGRPSTMRPRAPSG